MKCTYCDCRHEATKIINGWSYCDIHFEKISKIPVVNKVRGHVSKYEIEDEPEYNFDNQKREELFDANSKQNQHEGDFRECS